MRLPLPLCPFPSRVVGVCHPPEPLPSLRSADARSAQHQFVQWAGDLSGMFPNLSPEWALQIILGLIAISLMVPQYAGLAGISAALKIEVEPKQDETEKPEQITPGVLVEIGRAHV